MQEKAEAGVTDVYLEGGAKRVIAAALDWPGWCRTGKDEAAALAALADAGQRYAKIVAHAPLGLAAPQGADEFRVIERVAGGAATDMGVPEVVLARDAEPMNPQEVARAESVLAACWAALDRALREAQGKELRKGPRGGGRELEAIARHVAEAEASYTARVGLKSIFDATSKTAGPADALRTAHERVLEGLAAVATVGVPPPGPRGGARWPARYFVRRVAYHVVDHTWEIEDRSRPEV